MKNFIPARAHTHTLVFTKNNKNTEFTTSTAVNHNVQKSETCTSGPRTPFPLTTKVNTHTLTTNGGSNLFNKEQDLFQQQGRQSLKVFLLFPLVLPHQEEASEQKHTNTQATTIDTTRLPSVPGRSRQSFFTATPVD